MREINLDLIFSRMRAGWRTPVVLSVVAVMFTLYILATSPTIYHAEMIVIPAPDTQGQAMPNVGGTLGSILGISSGSQPGSDYVRYQRLLTSPVVAQRLQDHHGMLQQVFSGEWDKENQRWIPQPSLKRTLLGWLFRLSRVPSWTAPDATTLSGYLQSQITIMPSPTSDLVVVGMNNPSAAFAKRLLLDAHVEANALLRDQIARRARQQVRYLEAKLAQTTVADYRASLLNLLSSQEKTLMMTQTDASFAAEIVSPPVASSVPVSPRPVLSVVVAILVGVLAGFAIVIFAGPDWWRAPYARLSRWTAMIRGRNRNSGAPRQA